VLDVGDAETEEPVVALSPAEGDHAYVAVAPDAVSVNAGDPMHKPKADELAVKVGNAFTVITTGVDDVVVGPELHVTSQ
jgi:hypothetical protein